MPGGLRGGAAPLLPNEEPTEAIVTDWVAVDSSKDFTHQWKLNGLQAGKKYRLKIYARPEKGQKISDSIFGQFLLPANKNTAKDVKFCVVSCHDYNRRDDMDNGHKIYPSMSKLKPDFYVHTGDIEYMDKPFPYAMTEELMRFKWNRLFALPFQRSFYNNYTSYFMKDDHDVGYDDSYPERIMELLLLSGVWRYSIRSSFPLTPKGTKPSVGERIFRFGSSRGEITGIKTIWRMDQIKPFGEKLKSNGFTILLVLQRQL